MKSPQEIVHSQGGAYTYCFHLKTMPNALFISTGKQFRVKRLADTCKDILLTRLILSEFNERCIGRAPNNFRIVIERLKTISGH